MSYILDSLKKSERERQGVSDAAGVVLQAPAFLDNDKPDSPSFKIILLILLVVLIIAAVVFFWLKPTATIDQGFGANTGLEAPAQSPTVNQQNQALALKAQENSAEKQQAIALYEQALRQKQQPAAVNDLYRSASQPQSQQTVTLPALPPAVESTDSRIESSIANSSPVTTASSTDTASSNSEEAPIPSIYDLERLIKRDIPQINYGAHIYATDNSSGFVILNGARRRVGDRLNNGIYIEKIRAEDVILSYNGTVFSLPAMKSWSGE